MNLKGQIIGYGTKNMSSKYEAITHEDFQALMNTMGFHSVDQMDARTNYPKQGYRLECLEYVYHRNIIRDTPENMLKILNDEKPRYSVRIYSSVDVRNDVTRASGNDAIRVMLWHNWRGHPLIKRNIKRTPQALDRVLLKAREMWKAGAFPKPACPICEGLMQKRNARNNHGSHNKFWGCWDYPRCKGTRQYG